MDRNPPFDVTNVVTDLPYPDVRLSVQQVMQDMERAALKGEAGEEELKALEADVTGKILLASWRGTRFEVIQVLREVVDNVLKEPGVSDKVLYDRARVR